MCYIPKLTYFAETEERNIIGLTGCDPSLKRPNSVKFGLYEKIFKTLIHKNILATDPN